MEELIRRQRVKEAEEREFEEFIQLLKSAKNAPSHTKPPKSSWLANDKVRENIDSLKAYAIDAWASIDQRKLAGVVSQPHSCLLAFLKWSLYACEIHLPKLFIVWLLKLTIFL